MKTYKIKPEFWSNWGSEINEDSAMVNEEEIERLAYEWGVSVDDLMSQVEEEVEETAEDKLLYLYNRTMKNCRFYMENGKEDHLLNEIGVLRGIAYCMEAVLDGGNMFLHIEDNAAFGKMIAEQNRLLGK